MDALSIRMAPPVNREERRMMKKLQKKGYTMETLTNVQATQDDEAQSYAASESLVDGPAVAAQGAETSAPDYAALKFSASCEALAQRAERAVGKDLAWFLRAVGPADVQKEGRAEFLADWREQMTLLEAAKAAGVTESVVIKKKLSLAPAGRVAKKVAGAPVVGAAWLAGRAARSVASAVGHAVKTTAPLVEAARKGYGK